MSEPTLQELKELIISSRQDLELKLSELDKKLETGLIKLESEIKQVENKLEGEIKRVEGILSAKMDGIDKRLSNEEGITRAVFGGLILAVGAGVIKYLFFPNV